MQPALQGSSEHVTSTKPAVSYVLSKLRMQASYQSTVIVPHKALYRRICDRVLEFCRDLVSTFLCSCLVNH